MNTDFFGKSPIDKSIDTLIQFEPPEGYYGAFSGGKDSITIFGLVEMSPVKCDWHYQNTTVDPPQVIQLIRNHYPSVSIDNPPKSMWQLIPERGFPTRRARWCCEVLKERGGSNRIVLTGIRKEESNRRRNRKTVEPCLRIKSKSYVHPILNWTESEVWDFIRIRNLPYPDLYDKGYKRIGCVLCPFEMYPQRSLEDFPKICNNWRRAFQRLYDKGGVQSTLWPSAQAMWEWWISRNAHYPRSSDQLALFEMDAQS